MNELQDLDRRADAAVTDLQRAVAARPIPTFDADRLPLIDATPPPARRAPSRRPAYLAAAAVLALVVGTIVLLSRDRHDDRTLHVPAGDLVGWVLDPAPAGTAASAASSDPGSRGDGVAARAHLYGPAGGRARVLVIASDPDVATGDTDGDPFDLDGRRAWNIATAAGSGVNGVVVDAGADAWITVFGGQSKDVVQDIARAATVRSGEPVVAPAGLPDGWVDLGVASITPGDPYGSPTRIVFYDGGDLPTEASYQLMARRTGAEPQVADAMIPGDPTPVEVDGRPGEIVAFGPTGVGGNRTVMVTWEPVDGVTLVLTTTNVAEADVLAAAATARPSTPAEWQALVDASNDAGSRATSSVGEAFDPVVPAAASGTLADGSKWELRLPSDTSDPEVGDGFRFSVRASDLETPPASAGSLVAAGVRTGFGIAVPGGRGYIAAVLADGSVADLVAADGSTQRLASVSLGELGSGVVAEVGRGDRLRVTGADGVVVGETSVQPSDLGSN